MSWVQVFGGQTVYPAQLTYLPLALSTDVTLEWPVEQAMPGALVFADIIDVDASAPGLSITLPAADEGSNGAATLINNLGANTVTVRNAIGGTVLSLPSGTAWEVYLADNTTPAGVWRTFQFGASVSVVNAAALAGAGLKAIGSTLNQSMPSRPFSVNYVVVDSDRAQALVWTGGLGLFTLPAPGAVGSDWFIGVRNSGSGDLSVTPPGGVLIDGAASKTFPPTASAFIVCDGASYFTLGFGSGAGGAGSGFDFVTIDVAGAGNFVLAGAQLNRIGYQFIGVLTGTRNIIVPNTTQEYWVTNSTTGAFSLFVKTVAQVPGVEVLQTQRNILYCDGTNVVPAESSSVSFPIAINQGGTGATTATNALINLGGTAVGRAVFTAVDQAAARAAMSAVPTSRAINTGAGLTGGGDLTADRTLALAANIPTFEQGSYVGSFTGFTAAQNHTIHYCRVGNIVLLAVDQFAGTSNSTSFAENSGNMPVSIRPSDTVETNVFSATDSGAGAVASARIATNGNMTFFRWSGSGSWFNAGSKGISGVPSAALVSMTYIIGT
jgi:hypothetical protein